MSKTLLESTFLSNDTVTFTSCDENTVITVEHVGHNRCYVSYKGVTRVVPFMPAYQVVSEKSIECIKNRRFTTEYTPTTV